ncbi:MAG TPA: YMGG-like glycine zipper-containing protein [Segetibacter sp.]|jgi:hypothetical protein
MTKKFLAVAFAAVFAACNSNPKTTETTMTDTVGDAAARANDNAQSMSVNGVTDTLMTSDGSKYVKVDPNAAAALAPVAAAPVAKTRTPARTTTKRTTRSSTRGNSSGGTSSGSGTSTSSSSGTGVYDGTASTPVPAKKKGWSNSAKGAVIGAGAGAVGGAIISKKKGTGAIIGGVLGAAGGYIIGKNKDKKAAAGQ